MSLSDFCHSFNSILANGVLELSHKAGRMIHPRLRAKIALRRDIISIWSHHCSTIAGIGILRASLALPACTLWDRELQQNIVCRAVVRYDGSAGGVVEPEIEGHTLFRVNRIEDLKNCQLCRQRNQDKRDAVSVQRLSRPKSRD